MNGPVVGGDIAERYDTIAYAAQPNPHSHPDHLGALATLFGIDAPAVATCRVLEVGCSDGANLIPMALSVPGATFVGCDIAPRPIAAANETVAALGLTNVRLIEGDLAALGEDLGTFDFVIAHGVYSWVPAPVRDALFALAARRLAPNGAMFASYNTLPGCHVRRATWDILHWHVDRLEGARARLDAARAFAALLARPGTANEDSDAALRAEFARIAERADSPLYHDDLGVPNDPVWFHDFVAHAGRYGLAFVAEAAVATMSGNGLDADVRRFVDGFDRLAREQYLDCFHLRRYRQSVLARASATSSFAFTAKRMAGMAVSASTPLLRAAAQGDLDRVGAGDALATLQRRLVARAPHAVPVADVEDALRTSGIRNAVDVIGDAWLAGYAQLHVAPPRLALDIGERPIASALARWQATHREHLTNLRHETVRVGDATARAALAMLDGSRTHADVAQALAQRTPAPERANIPARIEQYLQAFGRLALLAA